MDSDAEEDGMSGITTVSLLVFMVVGTAVGALVGLFLSSIAHGQVLAIVAGLAGTIVATLARNALVFWEIGVGPDEAAMPWLVLLYGVIASLAGSLAGYEVAVLYEELTPFIIGGLAGLLSSILMGLLMITYHMPKE
jgi:hypothetical protein